MKKLPAHHYSHARDQNAPSLSNLHIVTYDVRGKLIETGKTKITRQTGIVTQTHLLLKGLADMLPGLPLSITQTGAEDTSKHNLLTPEGQTVYVQGIRSHFPEIQDPTGNIDKTLVKKYYEDEIDNPGNPLYPLVAAQYTEAIQSAGSQNLLLQNSNSIVRVLKAEELGYFNTIVPASLNITGVIHDVEGYQSRLNYIKKRFAHTKMNVNLIAISEFVRLQLEAIGIPMEHVFKVPNGLDIKSFDAHLKSVAEENLFEDIRRRNNLPLSGNMILIAARRVEHKGHLDVIHAAKILQEKGKLRDTYIVFTGGNMLSRQSSGFENILRQSIAENGLESTIFLLDPLNNHEVMALYTKAHISVLASTEPEGFGFANVEAMLAGVPVITTQLGGPLDYIENEKTGLFIEVHNPASLAIAIDRLLSDPFLHRTIVSEGRKKAEEYTYTNMTKGYIDVLTRQS